MPISLARVGGIFLIGCSVTARLSASRSRKDGIPQRGDGVESRVDLSDLVLENDHHDQDQPWEKFQPIIEGNYRHRGGSSAQDRGNVGLNSGSPGGSGLERLPEFRIVEHHARHGILLIRRKLRNLLASQIGLHAISSQRARSLSLERTTSEPVIDSVARPYMF